METAPVIGVNPDRKPTPPAVATRHALASIARRWFDFHVEIKLHTKRLDPLTAQAAPDLVAAFGIGSDIAGELLVATGDNTDRVRSEAAFAKLCGICPIPTGSGKTGVRSLTLSLPPGWGGDNLVVAKETGLRETCVAVLDVTYVYADPCHHNGTAEAVGPAVDHLAAALEQQPLRDSTVSDVEVDGFAASA